MNTIVLSDIIAKYKKWPGITHFTEEGDNCAFLILQHADDFKEFQEKCFNMLLVAGLNQETEISYAAYLSDRIMHLKYHLKQMFGTQAKVNGNGTITIFPVYDSSNLDYRRKLVGLNRIEDYIKETEKAISN